jgi:hypothetical protein
VDTKLDHYAGIAFTCLTQSAIVLPCRLLVEPFLPRLSTVLSQLPKRNLRGIFQFVSIVFFRAYFSLLLLSLRMEMDTNLSSPWKKRHHVPLGNFVELVYPDLQCLSVLGHCTVHDFLQGGAFRFHLIHFTLATIETLLIQPSGTVQVLHSLTQPMKSRPLYDSH